RECAGQIGDDLLHFSPRVKSGISRCETCPGGASIGAGGGDYQSRNGASVFVLVAPRLQDRLPAPGTILPETSAAGTRMECRQIFRCRKIRGDDNRLIVRRSNFRRIAVGIE